MSASAHRPALTLLCCAILCACGGGTSAAVSTPRGGAPRTMTPSGSSASSAIVTTALASEIPSAPRPGGRLRDWPEFGLLPSRVDATSAATGITARNVMHLRRIHVSLPGTVDSSPIYLHGVKVAGKRRDIVVATTTYGRTVGLDAATGRILWTFTPKGYRTWAGTAQITTASPLAGPTRRFVYAASPNGLIHKLSLANGSQVTGGGWPVRVTREPAHEKIAASLNIAGPYLLASTGGYYGDAPPYQGHVLLIDRGSGHVAAVFNTLCSHRRSLIVPSSCPSSDSAILSRAGPVVQQGGQSLLVATGNGPWNGTTDFGDSVLQLSVPGLRLLQAYTPRDQERLNRTDTDLGSSGPALLGGDRVAIAGKDGIIRVLSLSKLDGRAPGGAHPRQRLGGALQKLPLPGGGELFSAPAVWHFKGRTTMFVGAEHATAAYVLRKGRLRLAWRSPIPGTSPILAGGLLYVYDPVSGGIETYRPRSPHPIGRLPGAPGHWNSPIVVDGHVIEPEGDANAHRLNGSLEIFSVR